MSVQLKAKMSKACSMSKSNTCRPWRISALVCRKTMPSRLSPDPPGPSSSSTAMGSYIWLHPSRQAVSQTAVELSRNGPIPLRQRYVGLARLRKAGYRQRSAPSGHETCHAIIFAPSATSQSWICCILARQEEMDSPCLRRAYCNEKRHSAALKIAVA